MRILRKARQLPERLATGAFILNSGVATRSADEETAARLHGMAADAYPFLTKMRPKDFTRLLSATEIARDRARLAVLLPIVPAALAGAGLTTFPAGLLGTYVRTAGMRKEGSLRPTQHGTPWRRTYGCLESASG